MINLVNNKYIDEDFDGVSIKLRSFFLDLNPNVKDAIENLKKELQKAEYSIHEPNYKMSLYELENMENKVANVRQRKKELKDKNDAKLKANIEREKALLNADYLICEVKEITHVTARDNDSLVTFPNGDEYYLHEFLTGKDNLIKSMKDRFEEAVNTYDKMKEFSQYNPHLQLEYIDHFNVTPYIQNNLNIRLKVDSYGCVFITHNALNVRFYYRTKRAKNLVYQTAILHYKSDSNSMLTNELHTTLSKKYGVDLTKYKLDFKSSYDIKLIKISE